MVAGGASNNVGEHTMACLRNSRVCEFAYVLADPTDNATNALPENTFELCVITSARIHNREDPHDHRDPKDIATP